MKRFASRLVGLSLLATGMAFAVAQTAAAHHSFAMFNEEKAIKISGVVAKYSWVNPHMLFWLGVPDGKGGHTVWTIESPYGPSGLRRYGWTRETLKVGDQLDLYISPLRNGKPGGSLEAVHWTAGPNAGKTLYNGSRGQYGGLRPLPAGSGLVPPKEAPTLPALP